MILLALLLGVSGAALEVGVEVGWAGNPVVSGVNPLWLTLTNPSPRPFHGEVHILGTAGSPWRGEAARAAVIPVFLAPSGRTVLQMPWALDPGMTKLRVQVFSEGAEVFSRDFALESLGGTRLSGGIGPPGLGPYILIAPSDLPSDPLLLWPFSALRVSGALTAEAAEVVRAWHVFLGGESPLAGVGVAAVRAEAMRQRLRGLRPAPPIWSALVPGILLYLVGLGPGLAGLARGRSGLLLALVTVFLGLSLFYGVFRENAEGFIFVKVGVFSRSVSRFHLELVGVISWRGGQGTLPGWWHELLPSRGWNGLDLRWEYGPTGWTTAFPLPPGVPRVFLRVASDGDGAWEGEPVPPPPWVTQALDLPWAEAHAGRLAPGPREAEVLRVDLP